MRELLQSDVNLFGEVFATALFAGFFGLALACLRRGWRRRRELAAARYGAAPLAQAPVRPADAEALCTGTTAAGTRADRVALPELFGRWRCRAWIEADAVVLARPDGVALRLSGIRGTGLTGAHAGRAVGRDRIAVVRWTLGGHEVDTGLQFPTADEAQAFAAKVDAVTTDGVTVHGMTGDGGHDG